MRAFFLVFAGLFLFAAACLSAAPPAPSPSALDKLVGRRVASLIAKYHYSRRPFDDNISRQLYEEYFERLDPTRSYFLASDIAEFRSSQPVLDDYVLQGNLTFAYDVYARFLERVRDRLDFVRKRLDEPFDFTLDEAFLLDRSEQPWCASQAELDDLWRQRVKNNVLVYEMMNLASEDDSEQETTLREAPAPEPDIGQPDAEADADAPQAVPEGMAEIVEHLKLDLKKSRTPKQRVLQFYERFVRQLEEKSSTDVLELFLTTLARIYDPHSAYMAPDTEEDFDISMKLSLQGIGALLTTEDLFVKVAGIIPGGPAARDGRLKEGDLIIAVAQESKEEVDVIGMPLRKVVRMIRGQKDTRVYLTVWEADNAPGSTPVVIDILRDEVKLRDQEARSELRTIRLPMPAGGPEPGAEPIPPEQRQVAVISLPSFYADFKGKHAGSNDYKSSTRDVKRLVDEALRKDVAGLVLDLRGNGGGSLDEAIALAGLFFAEGPVVQVRVASGKVHKRYDPDSDTAYGGPLVVLTDRLSASASEIVAAALQDYGRAVIIGEGSTHGKGTVQTVQHLDRMFSRYPIFKGRKAGSLKYTMAKFYRVTGDSTQKNGVEPDIVFPSFTDHMELGEAHLPNVMPWDKIDPLEFSGSVDVSPFLPDLARRAEMRLGLDQDYRDYLQDIEAYAERKRRTTVTLNKEKRVNLYREEEEWSKRIKQARARNTRMRAGAEEGSDPTSDFMLTEALNVVADLAVLQRGQTLGPPPVVTETGGAPTPVVPDDVATRAVE